MTSTARLNLPLIDAGQAQKNITHNEAILALDQFVQAAVLSQTLAAPPPTNTEGDSYIVAASATGAWTGKTSQIAAWQQGVWNFYPPAVGCLVWIVAQSRIFAWTGMAWVDAFNLFSSTLQNMQLLGIGTTATSGNPLSAKINAALFTALATSEGGTGDLRFTLNKATAGNTVSQLYQNGYSGRAETGLCGDDHFHIKVSSDGTTWRDAINIDPATGATALVAPLAVTSGGTGGTTATAVRTAFGFDSYVFRNRLRNPSFTINQRAVSGTVTLAAGQYGHDGVKGGASGCTYTFSTSGLDTALTITAGSLLLPVEASFIEGGAYVLSHAGTAQARVWQGTGTSGSGTYAVASSASPLLAAGLTAATQTNAEFASGTVLRPQLEPGSIATAFERRPLPVEVALAERYFEKSYNALNSAGPGFVYGGATQGFMISAVAYGYVSAPWRSRKPAAPTVTVYDLFGNAGKVTYWAGSSWAGNLVPNAVFTNSTTFALQIGNTGYSSYQFDIVASAEI